MVISQKSPIKRQQSQIPKTLNVYTIENYIKKQWELALHTLKIPKGINPYFFLKTEAPKIANEVLPYDLLKQLREIQKSSSPYQVLKNLPCDSGLVDVPRDGKRPIWKESWISEAVLIGIAGAIGLEPLSYLQEKEGLLVHEVVPIPGQEHQLSNSGKVFLGFHTDHAVLHRCYRPEFLLLNGLVNFGKTPTLVACIDDALRELTPDIEQILRSPLFRIELPDSVMVWNGKKLLSEWKPLVTTGKNGEIEFTGNLHSVRAMNSDADRALQALIRSLNEIAREIILDSGTLMLLNNHRCLHARKKVEKDRWLQRIFCRVSLTDLREAGASVGPYDYVFDMRPLLLK